MRAITFYALLFISAWQGCTAAHRQTACNKETGENCGATVVANKGSFEIVGDTSSYLQGTENEERDSMGKADRKERQAVAANFGSFWTNPVTLGLMLGFLLIGPDHLGTLMALSTLTTGVASFKVGFAWGFGHSLGMIALCPIFFILREFSSKNFHVSLDSWEYYGDYFIGCSMLVVAVYFVYFESSYLERQKDGTYVAKGCACHSTTEEHEAADDGEDAESATKFCKSYKTGKLAASHSRSQRRTRKAKTGQGDQEHLGADDSEETPLLEQSEVGSSAARDPIIRTFVFSWRDMQSALVGAVQGLCCPMGLAGIGFMGRMSIASSGLLLFLFAVVFILASAIGSGAITLGWGAITSNGSANYISPRTMYRSSCVATFLLGGLWVAANAFGVLQHINFAEHINSKINEHVRGAAAGN